MNSSFSPLQDTWLVSSLINVTSYCHSSRDWSSILFTFISTLLDSSTTLHLITSQEHFLDFRIEDNPGMQTTNHGMLCTTSSGMCFAELILSRDKYRVTLHDCLHAPGVLVNLPPVGQMLEKGWDCEFKGSCGGGAPCYQLSYNGNILGSLPLIGNLCHVDLHFVHPAELTLCTQFLKEISAVAKSWTMLDLWHAQMGHPGGESVKCLPLIATGVQIDPTKLLLHCEACIMAKHLCKHHPLSKTPCTGHMLDLIHSDLCSLFPVRTPHAKLYFIVFLDDHSHLLNIQLLTSKDQALDV